MPDPEVYSARVIIILVNIKQVELARVKRRASTEEEQMVHKIPELLHIHCRLILRAARDTKARGGPPEVAPALG